MIVSASAGKRARTRDALLVAAQTLLLDHSAASLGIRQVASAAGLVHASFYNYYASVEALLEDLSALLLAAHGQVVTRVCAGTTDIVEIFALTTRQTLRFFAESPQFGHLLFDAGLPVDRFVSGLRAAMFADIARGLAEGNFVSAHPDVTRALVAGGIMGVALDLHRARLAPDAIDTATAHLLVMLGVAPVMAQRAAHAPAAFAPPPALPLGWQSIA